MGLSILLVEDEALIAMMAQDMLESLGHGVVRIATNLADAEAAIDDCSFDAALLDVNLNGDSSLPIARRLTARNLPFAFTTGYGAAGIPSVSGNSAVLTKPYSITELEVVLDMLENQLAGTSSMTSVSDSNLG